MSILLSIEQPFQTFGSETYSNGTVNGHKSFPMYCFVY